MGNFDAEAKEAELRRESAGWDISNPVPASEHDIPTIDVADYFASNDDAELAVVAEQLRVASEEVGFYQLTGHGIGSDQLADILEQTRRLHALPLATKQQILMDRPEWPLRSVGYMPVGERKLPTRDQGNLNEAFIVKSDRDIGFDDNQWLADAQLPEFRDRVETYARTVSALALRLTPIYAVAMGLERDFFAPAFESPFWRLRMTHYPPAAPRGEGEAFGIAPHVDTTFLTLLLTDGPGLTIFSHRRDRWITAPQVPGAFVVNSGELLRQWSNDRILSTRHFANNASPNDRYSVPFFFNATADFPMKCLPTCHGPGNPAKYPTISYLDSQAQFQNE